MWRRGVGALLTHWKRRCFGMSMEYSNTVVEIHDIMKSKSALEYGRGSILVLVLAVWIISASDSWFIM